MIFLRVCKIEKFNSQYKKLRGGGGGGGGGVQEEQSHSFRSSELDSPMAAKFFVQIKN